MTATNCVQIFFPLFFSGGVPPTVLEAQGVYFHTQKLFCHYHQNYFKPSMS